MKDVLLIRRGLLRSLSILMKATFKATTIETLRLVLFREIQILVVTTQYVKRRHVKGRHFS